MIGWVIQAEPVGQSGCLTPAVNAQLLEEVHHVVFNGVLGKEELAEKQIKLARPIVENENEYNLAVFESVCGNADKAIQMLAIALEKKQIGLNTLQRDPNLDFIRHDPRFQRLIELHDPILYGPAETNQ